MLAMRYGLSRSCCVRWPRLRHGRQRAAGPATSNATSARFSRPTAFVATAAKRSPEGGIDLRLRRFMVTGGDWEPRSRRASGTKACCSSASSQRRNAPHRPQALGRRSSPHRRLDQPRAPRPRRPNRGTWTPAWRSRRRRPLGPSNRFPPRCRFPRSVRPITCGRR